MSTHSSDPIPPDANPDPLTGEAGAHPVSTGIGAAAIGAAGLAVGAAVAGPIGVAVATVGGAFIGGYVGKAVGEVVDPTAEEAFWREAHPHQPFADLETTFEDYSAAYRVGYKGYEQHAGERRTFEEAEQDIHASYKTAGSKLPWLKARAAARAAWERVHRGEAKKSPPVNTGVSEAVLSQDIKSGSLSDGQMPR